MPAFDVTSVLEGYSKAIYATWFYYGPDRTLFDAGEGLASRLENRAFAIRRVLLTHGHLDHISGLPTLIHIRAAGMGEKTKPLQVFYPEGDRYVEGLKAHVIRAMGEMSYHLSWVPIGPGARIPLTSEDGEPPTQHERWVETFATKHRRGILTLGYRIIERRSRLKPEYAGRPEPEIRSLVKERGKGSVTEAYDHRLLAYLGDGVPIPAQEFAGADVLLHEATFIEAADRENYVHSTLDEAVLAAKEAGVRNLVLFHVSSRYPRRVIRQRVREVLIEHGFPAENAWVTYERHIDRADTLK